LERNSANAKAIHIAKSLKNQSYKPKLVNKYVFANAIGTDSEQSQPVTLLQKTCGVLWFADKILSSLIHQRWILKQGENPHVS
jgi:hypothetical protein